MIYQKNIRRILLVLVIANILWVPNLFAQTSPKSIKHLVRIQDIDQAIVLDLRYATADNFTHQQVYPLGIGLLREETAKKLMLASQEFQKDGYRIKVWDAYRPPYVQKIFWKLMPDDRYVANPYKGGSKHNRGSAVDITLVDQAGHEIEMPSAFDDFSQKAWPTDANMTPQAKKNMDYLRRVMMSHGFDPIEHEWWHFDDHNWRKFPLVDVALERFLDAPQELSKLSKHITQVVVVEQIPGSVFKSKVGAWERRHHGWQAAFAPMDAVVGRNGIISGNDKREGDGFTPGGAYSLGIAFGYERGASTKLDYRVLKNEDIWIDDPQSVQYNRWSYLDKAAGAKSFETMKRKDDLYKLGVVIQYNEQPVVAGKGSAIFLHIWRSSDKPTAGCVALSEENIVRIVNWLDRNRKPVIIIKSEK